MNFENFEKTSRSEQGRTEAVSDTPCVATDFDVTLGKCYVYASKSACLFPDEYRAIYEKVTQGIESLDCAENVRTVLRLRYNYGHRFNEIAKVLGVTYQWVYELHITGVRLLEKHLSL